MIEGFNINSGIQKIDFQQNGPVTELESSPVKQIIRPTRVNNMSSKDDKNRMGAQLELNEEEQKYLEELKKRDREVRTHEAAHKRVGGQYAGAVSYTYQTGPDNKQYAIGGETDLDTSKEGNPEKNIDKQEIIYKAAMAPKDPSRKDKEVAAEAQSSERESRVELKRDERLERELKLKEQEDAKAEAAAESEYNSQGAHYMNSEASNLNVFI